ncbi:MAG: hypothetical protein QM831_31540 [Kofleriaceae bacterium]
MTSTGGETTARLFLDETGQFSSACQMRLVGGLLTIASNDPSADLSTVHTRAASHIGWPVRLHALELSKPGYMALWAANKGIESCNVNLPSNTSGQIDKVLAEYPPPANSVIGSSWSKPARRFASENADRIQDHKYGKSLGLLGRILRAELVSKLASEFQGWCTKDRAAYMIAGHVDDERAPGLEAYVEAFNSALDVASRTAVAMGATKLVVTIANPNLSSVAELSSRIAQVPLPIDAQVVDYEKGPAGLWIADTLLSWCRPHPKAHPTPLDLDCSAARCLIAQTTHNRPHPFDDTFAKFLVATQESSRRMVK